MYYYYYLSLPTLLLLICTTKLGLSVPFPTTTTGFVLPRFTIIIQRSRRIQQHHHPLYTRIIIFTRNMASTNRKRSRETKEEEETIDTSQDDKIGSTCSPQGSIVMILSPAKTFDLSVSNIPTFITNEITTKPNCCPMKTRTIATFMKQQSPTDLMKLLSLSKSLTSTTYDYWQNFILDDSNDNNNDDVPMKNAKPCIYMYSGAAYQGLAIQECNLETVLYLQQNLRILDAVYGILRPLDIIQPYRLEMATKNINVTNDENGNNNNHNKKGSKQTKSTKLHDYWSDAITTTLSEDLMQKVESTDITDNDDSPTKSTILLNLASEEYSVVVDETKLPVSCRYIKCIFLNDNRVVSVHAKRARGLMVRYLAENNITTFDGIQQFNLEGYTFVADRSDDTTLVFNRSKKQQQQSSTVAKATKSTATAAGSTTTSKTSATTNRNSRRKAK